MTSTPKVKNHPDKVVSLRGVSKLYQLFDDPRDRLKHLFLWRFGKSYGHIFWAVQNISFDLHRGEMLGIIGKNGSGKSTILQMIAGTLTPTEGSIACLGRVGALLELGSGFNPDYTGRENIELNASILGISSGELKGKIESIVEFADIGDYIDQPVKLYSSGMFMRLAFAVSTGLDADILLIDEALAVGDVFFRQKCYQRLAELRKKGTAIILVTHNLIEVEQYCDIGILLDAGKIVFRGDAKEAVRHYYLMKQSVNQVSTVHEDAPRSNNVYYPGSEIQTKGELFWPPHIAFQDATQINAVTNGWARCLRFALCEENGQPQFTFEQGQSANFYFEFELLHDISVPIFGIVIRNDHRIIVHGKNSLQVESNPPLVVQRGQILRICQNIKLDIQKGEYTFQFGLSTISAQDFSRRNTYSHHELDSKLMRLWSVANGGFFSVVLRATRNIVELPFHGLADLTGAISINIKQ